MESPVKKLSFESGKENSPAVVDASATTLVKPAEKPAVQATPKVAPGIKEMEANEPLLQENPHRFVLFPIKYHEVSDRVDASRVKWFCRVKWERSI